MRGEEGRGGGANRSGAQRGVLRDFAVEELRLGVAAFTSEGEGVASAAAGAERRLGLKAGACRTGDVGLRDRSGETSPIYSRDDAAASPFLPHGGRRFVAPKRSVTRRQP